MDSSTILSISTSIARLDLNKSKQKKLKLESKNQTGYHGSVCCPKTLLRHAKSNGQIVKTHKNKEVHQESKLCRVISAVDADCFEVQLSQMRQEWAHTIGEPTIVAQHTGR